MTTRIQFADLEFDPNSGELFRTGGPGEDACGRLSPQPARLLSFLIEQSPEIVSLEQIRELLWPDVQIEFEQSLHFCVRQIRAALGDSATAPRFIETVPRRGYRFIADRASGREPISGGRGFSEHNSQTDLPGGDFEGLQEPPETRTRFPGAVRWVTALVALPVAGLTLLSFLQPRALLPSPEGDLSSPIRRVGIMSFEPLDPVTNEPLRNGVAEAILSLLTAQKSIPLEVVGPTTTSSYESRPAGLLQLIDDYQLDFVVNGRLVEREGVTGVLAEIIRARDGAHVWVQVFQPFPQGEEIALSIADGLLKSLAEEG